LKYRTITDVITWDRNKLIKFKNVIKAAQENRWPGFFFEGMEFDLTYAQYLAEHLNNELPIIATLQQQPRAMTNKITIQQLASQTGMTEDELIEEGVNDSVCYALCKEECRVEPDGRCEHGCPSILLAMGLI